MKSSKGSFLLVVTSALFLFAQMIPPASAEPTESQLQTQGPEGPLAGTLLVPNEHDGPVVLIVPGSGPTDRDGNNPHGVQAATYRLLAEGLAERGIASLRVDKRGMFASSAAIADANAVTIADYADDVHSWAAAVRESTGVDCLWLLGHSEGGLVALAAAHDKPDAFCGLLLVSTPGRPMGDVLRQQLSANPANAAILDDALAAIDEIEAERRIDTSKLNPALMPLFHKKVQGFLIDLFSYDPAALLEAYPGPVLILQGLRDLQISETDARRLSAVAPQAELHLLPDTNHVLKPIASGDPIANYATYGNPNLPLAPAVVGKISDFLLSSNDAQ